MDNEDKKYKLLNLMSWNEEEQDNDVELMSLTDEYTKITCEENDVYPDANKYIGKPRYYYLTLKRIQKYVYDKENVDLFCKHNPECYGEEFNIYNPDYEFNGSNIDDMVIKYKPQK